MIGIKRWLVALITLGILLECVMIPICGKQTEAYLSEIIWENRQKNTLKPGSDFTYIIPVVMEGLYDIEVEYQTMAGHNITPQALITLAGSTTIVENKSIDFSRIWMFNDGAVKNGRFEQDKQGNELIPSYREIEIWQKIVLPLIDGGVPLKEGEYRLSFAMQREVMQIRSVTLLPAELIKSYEAYKTAFDASGVTDATINTIRQEAEMLSQKSHLEIAVNYDRSSPAISPNDPKFIRYNLLGGSQFGTEGQWVNWTLNIPQSGYYEMDFIYRQNINNGLSVRRSLQIDGEVPFKECEVVEFPFSEELETKTLANEKGVPYRFYMKSGKHTVRMEVVLTGLKETLIELNAVIAQLNLLFNKIMVVVGETPDLYRDYDLDTNIVGLTSVLSQSAERLNVLVPKLGSKGGSNAATLSEAARTMLSMKNDPRKIPQRMDRFRAQINTLADLLGTIRTQPLELDYFVLRPPAQKVSKSKTSGWELFKYRMTGFLSSFFQDYNTIGGDSIGKPMNVWVTANDGSAGFGTGRDQAQIINRLVTDSFTSKTDIPVRVSLLDSGTLTSALVSGKGPDLALFVPKDTVVNLYYRKALTDLTQMSNFSEIKNRFYPSALISLQLGEKVYALPEVQTYAMMFYRSDIFKENSFTPPDTWTEFYTVLNRIQKKGMQVGVPESSQIYEMFLLQNNGSLYNKDISETRMTETASVNAFTSWTDLYTKFGLPISYDALNRFRTGQMPLLLASLPFYGQLMIGAPEISGQWKMAPLPSTVTTTGKNRQEVCAVSGAVVLKKSDKQEQAFRFLDWWTSNNTQEKFAFECESKLGISGRYFPANKAAFDTMAWTAEEVNVLKHQWEQVSDNPQSPATYFVNRNLSNAFRRVVYNLDTPRDVIYRYGQLINDELKRKRDELELQ